MASRAQKEGRRPDREDCHGRAGAGVDRVCDRAAGGEPHLVQTVREAPWLLGWVRIGRNGKKTKPRNNSKPKQLKHVYFNTFSLSFEKKWVVFVSILIKGEVRRFFFICSKFLLAQN